MDVGTLFLWIVLGVGGLMAYFGVAYRRNSRDHRVENVPQQPGTTLRLFL